jgi:hypothetical protein
MSALGQSGLCDQVRSIATAYPFTQACVVDRESSSQKKDFDI